MHPVSVIRTIETSTHESASPTNNEVNAFGKFLFEQWSNKSSLFNRNIVTKGLVAATNTIGGFLDVLINTTLDAAAKINKATSLPQVFAEEAKYSRTLDQQRQCPEEDKNNLPECTGGDTMQAIFLADQKAIVTATNTKDGFQIIMKYPPDPQASEIIENAAKIARKAGRCHLNEARVSVERPGIKYDKE